MAYYAEAKSKASDHCGRIGYLQNPGEGTKFKFREHISAYDANDKYN